MKSLYQKAFKVLEISFGEAHSSGVKLFMEYRYGKPRDLRVQSVIREQAIFNVDLLKILDVEDE